MITLPVAWLAETILAATLLMIGVLVLRHPAARLFGARISYLLWALPALRMVLPPIPKQQIADLPVGIDLTAIEPASGAPALVETASSVGAASINWASVILAVWALGVIVHLTWHILTYWRFVRTTAGSTLYSLGGVAVQSAAVDGPAAAGIVHRRILLPRDFTTRFDEKEQRLALAHELAHHRRGDLWANWAALVLLSLHWFNPVAHLAYRAFRADQELACDATVLRASPAEKIHAYASAIVKATWDRGLVAACPLNRAEQLKRRLRMMTSTKKSLARTLSGLALAVATISCGLALTASARAAAVAALAPIQPLLVAAGTVDLAPARTTSTPAPKVEEPALAVTESSKIETQPVEQLALATPAPAVQAQDTPPSPAVISAPSTPATKMMRYTLYDLEDREFVVPASKALLDDLMRGRGPNGEPVEVLRVTIEGLSPQDTAAISSAMNVRNAGSAPFEGPWAGTAKIAYEWGRRRSRDARVAPTEDRAQAALPAARATLGVALSRPEKASFRQVYAAYAPGGYNGVSPGVGYIGFCGEIDTGGVTSAWRKFFVSETPSTINGVAQKIFYGAAAADRCGGRREGDYTFDFEMIRVLTAKFAGQ